MKLLQQEKLIANRNLLDPITHSFGQIMIWNTEELQRSGYTLLTVYRDDEVIGSLTFPEGDSQIGKWKTWVTSLNNQNGTATTPIVGVEKK